MQSGGHAHTDSSGLLAVPDGDGGMPGRVAGVRAGMVIQLAAALRAGALPPARQQPPTGFGLA